MLGLMVAKSSLVLVMPQQGKEQVEVLGAFESRKRHQGHLVEPFKNYSVCVGVVCVQCVCVPSVCGSCVCGVCSMMSVGSVVCGLCVCVCSVCGMFVVCMVVCNVCICVYV